MLSVAEAQELILQHVRPVPPEPAPLTPALLGRLLAEDVVSDLDSPPHDKAMVDGYAVCLADLGTGHAVLPIVEEITAGRTPQVALHPGQASKIMTGAPIPSGAEAVVLIERTRMVGDRVEITDRVSAGQNILRRGQELRKGQCVLAAGTILRPVEVGVLATVGHTVVQVTPSPRVAVVATGDEVVEPDQTPGPGQLRNSNGPMLLALAAREKTQASYLGIARDDLDSLRSLIRQGLAADVLILSGGVSMGTLDLVPGVLREEGAVPRLHKVAMKPGKPIFFGTRETATGRTLVFGLPGNPVSALACFALFVRPALRRLAGHPEPLADVGSAILHEDYPYRSDRPTYHPARVEVGAHGWQVRIVPWGGSADLLSLTRANALVLLPAGDHVHRAGSVFTVVPLDL
jgi:molybdopterin molybdotransferase